MYSALRTVCGVERYIYEPRSGLRNLAEAMIFHMIASHRYEATGTLMGGLIDPTFGRGTDVGWTGTTGPFHVGAPEWPPDVPRDIYSSQNSDANPFA
jgi:hypothetical protein